MKEEFTVRGMLNSEALLDRKISLFTTSGHTFIGFVGESPTDGICLYKPKLGESSGYSYQFIQADQIVAWEVFHNADGDHVEWKGRE